MHSKTRDGTCKRPRREDMADPVSGRPEFTLQEELDITKNESECAKKPSPGGTVRNCYIPTYRAVLAQHGILVKETLGTGSYSKVKFAHCIARDRVAVKIIDRYKAPKDFQNRFLPRELAVWPKIKHPHIITMFHSFQDNRRVYMVLEYAENGDVLRYIQRNGALEERVARTWVFQVVDAVSFLHDRNIAHRDLKLENLLIDGGFNIKLCDFGFVKENCMNELSKTYCGSKSYASPEILKGEPYDPKKADVWALGVIIYITVTGKMPFDESQGNKGVLAEHLKLQFPWSKMKAVVSSECKDLIYYIFQYNFRERPSIHDVVGHGWFRTGYTPRHMHAAHAYSAENASHASHHGHHRHTSTHSSVPHVVPAKSPAPLQQPNQPHVHLQVMGTSSKSSSTPNPTGDTKRSESSNVDGHTTTYRSAEHTGDTDVR